VSFQYEAHLLRRTPRTRPVVPGPCRRPGRVLARLPQAPARRVRDADGSGHPRRQGAAAPPPPPPPPPRPQPHPPPPPARRAAPRRAAPPHLVVLRLLPPEAHLDAFERDSATDKREKLVDALLADKNAFAEHWMSFWNDLLRNDEQTNIDGLRKPITAWLF